MTAAFNNEESEEVILDGGYRVATGLQMPTEDDIKVQSTWATFPESWFEQWDDKAIQNALVATGGEQRYLKSRVKRRRRIRNQSELGKCNASSNASGGEQIREVQGMADIPLADCFTYIQVNGGVDEGSSLPSTFTNIQKVGLCPYSLQVGGMTKRFPNNAFKKSQVAPDIWAQAVHESARFRAVKCVKLPTDDFELFCRAAAIAIARKMPIVWAWHVGRNGSSLKNGMMQLGNGVGNHSNLIHEGKWVGGKTLVQPDNQNSWGPVANEVYGPKGASWGEGGFGLTTMEGLFSCVKYHPPYILVSFGADDQEAE